MRRCGGHALYVAQDGLSTPQRSYEYARQQQALQLCILAEGP